MSGLVYFGKVEVGLAKINCVHTASNIDTDNIGNDLVDDSHRCADRASCARVYVRHNANAAASCELVVTHSADLLDCLLFAHFGVADCCIHFALDLKHTDLLLSARSSGLFACGLIFIGAALPIHQ